MKVIVLIEGMYSDQSVAGVFNSFDKLIARYPEETWRWCDIFECWENTKDFGEYLSVELHEVDDEK